MKATKPQSHEATQGKRLADREFRVAERGARRRRGTALFVTLLIVAPAFGQARLKTYETRYYVLHTDLDRDALREVDARITAMAEMYHQRTKTFAGRITKKLPFYLFSNPADYYESGGLPGSAGMFDGKKLMAIAGRQISSATWHIVQHEGFHQFIHAVIGGDIPAWVNEGLAEYFGQGIYTGDGYVTGVVPPERLQRVQHWIETNKSKSIDEMMTTSYASWNAGLSAVNYDQAWSMVHFLAHAEGGRYQDRFSRFIKDVSRGMKWEHAWRNNFEGSGTKGFERKWQAYWSAMPADATVDLYAKATVATLTSFYGRAFSQRQVFRTFDSFQEVARAGRVKSHSKDWLPPSLLAEALERVDACGEWEVRKYGARYALVCTTPGGSTVTGSFKVSGGRLIAGSVEVAVESR